MYRRTMSSSSRSVRSVAWLAPFACADGRGCCYFWWLPGYGTVATVLAGSPSTRIEIINLATGADHPLPSRIASSVADEGWESMVWSPDSRWLFLAANGDLYAVGSCTGEITDLSHTLGTRCRHSLSCPSATADESAGAADPTRAAPAPPPAALAST